MYIYTNPFSYDTGCQTREIPDARARQALGLGRVGETRRGLAKRSLGQEEGQDAVAWRPTGSECKSGLKAVAGAPRQKESEGV